MKRYGVRITLPEDDPMRAPHLLGPEWEAFRWFDSQEERDSWLEEMLEEHVYSRRGDIVSQRYEKLERSES